MLTMPDLAQLDAEPSINQLLTIFRVKILTMKALYCISDFSRFHQFSSEKILRFLSATIADSHDFDPISELGSPTAECRQSSG
uniref:Uncharacterized protein n=1 Tax=Romanomermis culicivorax TaxID=13658 RepID=A0A915I752_ROMCU